MLISSFIIIGGSYHYNQQQLDSYNDANRNLSLITEKYKQAQTKKRWLSQYKQSFAQLKKDRIIGNGDRLGWIESIDRIAQFEKIPYIKFTLNKLETAELVYLQLDMTGLSLFKTVMEINLNLLHEGDLFVLFSLLEEQTKGVFLINSCELKNQVKDKNELFQPINYKAEKAQILKNVYRHNIDGKCLLNWYTIREAEISNDPPPPP